jgi:hypothetical protein
MSFSPATTPFSAAAWTEHAAAQHVPLPDQNNNPLKRAAAVWRQQHAGSGGGHGAGDSADAKPWGGEVGGFYAAGGAPAPSQGGPSTARSPALCPAGSEGRCAAVIRASQTKLRLWWR